MIERQPVSDPRPTVVRNDREALVPQSPHHRHQLGSDLALVPHRVAQKLANAVSGKVRSNDGMAGRERRCDRVPGRMGLRVAVQKQERRSRAATTPLKRTLAVATSRALKPWNRPSSRGEVILD